MKFTWPTALLLLGSLGAFLQPKWGVEEDAVREQGIDLLICLDVSRSMLARDVSPDRLGRAKAEIEALLQRLDADRVGLILMAGEAQRVAPLTNDFQSFRAILDLASPESVFQGGTNLASALQKAQALFDAAPSTQKNVLLISDGEDRSGSALEQAKLCRKDGIVIYALGLGTEAGSKMTLRDEQGVEFFLTDEEGVEVVSKLDSSSLARIAEMTGGTLLSLSAQAGVLVPWYEQTLLPRAQQAFAADDRLRRANRFQLPLFFGLLGSFFGLAGFGRRQR